ncbi:MAG: hypothetical protein HGB15_10835 [Chlorobaculum sp.]|nr:hypothetical protein [Chlorobaculum sp.]
MGWTGNYSFLREGNFFGLQRFFFFFDTRAHFWQMYFGFATNSVMAAMFSSISFLPSWQSL